MKNLIIQSRLLTNCSNGVQYGQLVGLYGLPIRATNSVLRLPIKIIPNVTYGGINEQAQQKRFAVLVPDLSSGRQPSGNSGLPRTPRLAFKKFQVRKLSSNRNRVFDVLLFSFYIPLEVQLVYLQLTYRVWNQSSVKWNNNSIRVLL